MLATAQIHLGDLPTWLAAVGTVGALGAAFWQIGAERRRRHERETQEHEERHRAQARLIAAVSGPEEHGGIESQASDRTGIELINGSPEPVYRLLVAIVRIQGAGSPSSIESWIEREKEEREKRQHWTKEDYEKHWPLLTVPITTASILPSGSYRVWLQGIWGRGTGERHGAEVAFTDRAGSHWVRRATGQLEELGEDPITHYRGAGPHDLQMPERLT